MSLPNRHGSSNEYRYGFNGMEKDDEVSGEGNSYTAQYWQYDSRLGRRWNIDPVVKHHESPYATFANNPIWFADPNGADSVNVGGSTFWKVEKGDSYWSIGQRTGVDYKELQTLNSQNARSLKIGSLLILQAPFANITIENMSQTENITNSTDDKSKVFMGHLTGELRTLMLGTNILMSNISKNYFGVQISATWSEQEKQFHMKLGGTATANILLMEFITGTGPEHRRFGPSNNITKHLMNSSNYQLAYNKWVSQGRPSDGVYMGYSPDKGGSFSGGVAADFLGGTTWYFNERGGVLDVRVVNEFNIESFNAFGRLRGMMGDNSGIKSIQRARLGQDYIIPLSTTKQTFYWTVPMNN